MKNTVNVEHVVIEMFDIIQTIIYEADLTSANLSPLKQRCKMDKTPCIL